MRSYRREVEDQIKTRLMSLRWMVDNVRYMPPAQKQLAAAVAAAVSTQVLQTPSAKANPGLDEHLFNVIARVVEEEWNFLGTNPIYHAHLEHNLRGADHKETHADD